MINTKQLDREFNSRVVEIQSDFIQTAGVFITNTNGANAGVAFHTTNDNGGRPGIARFTGGTTTTGLARIGLNFSNTFLLGFGEWYAETSIQLQQLTNTTDGYFIIFGFVNNPTSPTNGVYIQYSQSSPNFELVVRNNGTTNIYNTGVPVNITTWYTIKMFINKDATSVKLSINGISSEYSNLNIPKQLNRTVDFGLGIFNTIGTITTRYLFSDYLYLKGYLNTVR